MTCTYHRPGRTCESAPFADVAAGVFVGPVCASHLQRLCTLAEAGKVRLHSATRVAA